METPLYEIHKDLGARFTDFHGWRMPLQYRGIVEEALAVRNETGVFDVSHMGRFLVRGKGVKEKLQKLTTNNFEKLREGKVQYNLITNEEGGIKDDVTVYMLSEESYMFCVNAGNRGKVKNWLSRFVDVEDISQETVQIALQGPESRRILSEFYEVGDLRFYTFRKFGEVIVSRTGYTGELGYEIYLPVEEGIELFRKLCKKAQPCGLGARDVLRIEAGFPLYGHEIDESITPLEANLDRFVDLSKDFVGKEAMLSKKVSRKLFGLELTEKGVPRQGYKIYRNGTLIGQVSSGTYSPYLKKGIALCFVDLENRKEGLEVELEVRSKKLKGKLRSYPFVKKR